MSTAGNVTTAYARMRTAPDRVLVDVSWRARRCGFTCPVALTRRVWAELVADREHAAGRRMVERLWPVLRGLGPAVVGQITDGSSERPRAIRFKASVWRHERRQFVPVSLRAGYTVCSDGRGYLAVTMPDE